jgi:ATP-dependent Clp protease ATP-binding subunit ClpA
MYERFTDRARKVMQSANQEAQRLRHEYVGTEHILLGLVKEGSGVAANVLKNLDIDLRRVRLELDQVLQVGPEVVPLNNLLLTPRVRKIIDYARKEARELGHEHIGTEHLLLGLLREQEGVAAQVLINFGLRLKDVHEEVLRLLGGYPHRDPQPPRDLPVILPHPLTAEDFPARIRDTLNDLDLQIEALNQRKEDAVAAQDFEWAAHLRDQADRIKTRKREVIRDWRSGYAIDRAWLTRNSGTAGILARRIFEFRRWDELPILADALEEAGCTDRELLEHCRHPGNHGARCFTDKARKVMQYANQEAQRFKHEYVGTEHILLGLIKEGSGVAVHALMNLGIDLRQLRQEVEVILQFGPYEVPMGKLPQTPRAKKVITYAIVEARDFNHNYVGTEHVLLGLLREQEGLAAQVLMMLGLSLEVLREQIGRLLGHEPEESLPKTSAVRRPELQHAPAEEFPESIRQRLKDLDDRIEILTLEKEAAVAQMDFENAACLRDQADQLKQQKAAVVRDWRAGYPIDPAWLSANSGEVERIAHSIDELWRWYDLPKLADALEEAGCTNREMLDHCRQPGEHGLRCWVIDLLLDRK